MKKTTSAILALLLAALPLMPAFAEADRPVRPREGTALRKGVDVLRRGMSDADAGFALTGGGNGLSTLPPLEALITPTPAPREMITPSPAPPTLAPKPENRQSFAIPARVVNCKEYVSLRSQPSTGSAALQRVSLGSSVTVVSRAAYKSGDNYFVQCAVNGQTGYILIEYIDTIIEGASQARMDSYGIGYGTVTADDIGDDLILRSGPGSDYANQGYLFGGEVMDYLGEARMDSAGVCWYHAELEGEAYWVSARYTRLLTPDGHSYTGKRGVY